MFYVTYCDNFIFSIRFYSLKYKNEELLKVSLFNQLQLNVPNDYEYR